MCPLSSHGREKALPQVVHTQGSVWERMCILSAPRLVYSLGQCLQWKLDRPVEGVVIAATAVVMPEVAMTSSTRPQWVSWCLERAVGLLQLLPQCAHWKRSVGSGLGGSDVRPSSSSPLLPLLLLLLDGELRSRGAVAEGVVGDTGAKDRGRAPMSHTRPPVQLGTTEPFSVGSSAKGNLSGTTAKSGPGEE